MARKFSHTIRINTYEQWVTWFLALDYIEVADIMDHAQAVRIGVGHGKVPKWWLDLLTDDFGEKTQWQAHEFQSEPDDP